MKVSASRMIIGVVAASLCAGTLVQIARPPKPFIFYNESESAAPGWYAINRAAAVEKDALVAAFLPQEARAFADERGYLPSHIPVIKTIWAAPGDEICADNGAVSATERPTIFALSEDRLGRTLPAIDGCLTLQKGEYFLVSTRVAHSFDSRYFGAVREENILGIVRYLGADPKTEKDAGGAEFGRARVER